MLCSAFQWVLSVTTGIRTPLLTTGAGLCNVDQHTASSLRPPCLVQCYASAIQNPAYNAVGRANSVLERAAKARSGAKLDLASKSLAVFRMNPREECTEGGAYCGLSRFDVEHKRCESICIDAIFGTSYSQRSMMSNGSITCCSIICETGASRV
jgi:hypothetical protein